VYKTIGLYLIVRYGLKMIVKDAIFETFTEYVRKIFGEGTSDKAISDTALALEINSFVAANLYLLRGCFYSFFMESLAD
jgi:hypothetical protein